MFIAKEGSTSFDVHQIDSGLFGLASEINAGGCDE